MNMLDTLSQRLLISRKQLNLNQQDVARRANVNRSYISDLETGRITNPTVSVIERIASAIQVQPQYLTCWSDNPTGDEPPASIHDGRIVYQVETLNQYRIVQDILDELADMPNDDQYLALQLVRQINRVRRGPHPESLPKEE